MMAPALERLALLAPEAIPCPGGFGWCGGAGQGLVSLDWDSTEGEPLRHYVSIQLDRLTEVQAGAVLLFLTALARRGAP